MSTKIKIIIEDIRENRKIELEIDKNTTVKELLEKYLKKSSESYVIVDENNKVLNEDDFVKERIRLIPVVSGG